MKKNLLLALAFAAACGYVMAAEEAPVTPAEEETTQTQPATEQPATESQEDEALDMDSMLEDETEEAK